MNKASSLKKIGLLAVTSLTLTACINLGGTKLPGQTGGDDLFSGSLQAAMELGVPMRCTYEVDGMEYEGIVMGKKYAGKVKQQNRIQNVVMADNFMYTWEDGKTQGLKIAFNPEDFKADAEDLKNAPEAEQVALPDVNYKCLPSLVTNADFTPPQSVTFMDLDQLLQGNLTPEQLKALEQMGQ